MAAAGISAIRQYHSTTPAALATFHICYAVDDKAVYLAGIVSVNFALGFHCIIALLDGCYPFGY